MLNTQDPRMKALTAGHPHHDLLFRKGTLQNSQNLTKGDYYLNRYKLSKNLTEDFPSHLVVPFEERKLTSGIKHPPAKHKPSPLEIAYRAQPSRIFRQPAYERDPRGLTQIERMLPHKVMQLESEFKTSDFQPKDPPPPPSNFGVQTLRTAHMSAMRNAGQTGFPTYQNTYPVDGSFQLQQHNAQSPPQITDTDFPSNYQRGKTKRVNNAATLSGAFDDSTYYNDARNKRRRF
jgi:hypothetical protein